MRLRYLTLAILHVTLLTGAAEATTVTLTATVEDGANGRPTVAQVQLVPMSSLPGDLAPVRLETKMNVPGEVVVDVTPGIVWSISATAEGLWTEARLVDLSHSDEPMVLGLTFVAGASLVATVAFVDAHPEPLEFELQLQRAPPERKEGPVTINCPLMRRELVCAIPAGRFDLRLRAGMLMPVYRWGVELPARQLTRLGVLRLRRGASVVGWVEGETGLPLNQARITLRPSHDESADQDTSRRLAALVLDGSSNERGFFQIEGVRPGEYVLTVSHPGLSPAQVRPIVVRASLESAVLEPIRLARPATLKLSVTPPISPEGVPWLISMTRKTDGVTITCRASQKGRCSPGSLSVGAYDVSVSTSIDPDAVWHVEEIEVRGSMPPLIISLSPLEVRGRTSIADEPVSAGLLFHGRDGLQVRMRSDDGGIFRGFLPYAGKWRIEITDLSGDLTVPMEVVELKPLPALGYAELEVSIPDTTLEGDVVDDASSPVPGAQIAAAPYSERGMLASAKSDDEGKFRIRGLPPGSGAARATDLSGRLSEWLPFALEEGRRHPSVQLVVRMPAEIRGRVLSSWGPVAGAMIIGWPEFGTVPSSTSEAVTDPEGAFSMVLPPEAAFANLLISPPGMAMRLLKVRVERDVSLAISVEQQGGTVLLRFPSGSDGRVFLSHNGTGVSIPVLAHARRTEHGHDGSSLTVANVEAGHYIACVGGPYDPARPDGERRCEEGNLLTYGELLLDLSNGGGTS